MICLRLYGKGKVILINKKYIKSLLIIIITLTVTVMAFNFALDIFLRNISEYLENYLNNYTQMALNNAIIEISNNYDFETTGFVRVNTSASGQTAYVETDTISINEFKGKVANKIIENMRKDNKKDVNFKVLNLLGNTYWINKGPSIKITVFPIGNVKTDLNSKFSQAGVNQTMHELVMTAELEARIVFPFGSIKKNGKANIPISNTVIVGEVPDSYVNVTSDTENLRDDILQLATN